MISAQIIILNHPGKIRPGYTPVICCHTSHIPCKWTKFESKVDKRNGKVVQDNTEFFVTGEAGMIQMVPTKPMSVEVFASYPVLGRFAVIDGNQTVAVGVIKES